MKSDLNAVVIAAGSWQAEAWAENLKALDPGRMVAVSEEFPDAGSVRYAVAWRPPAGELSRFPNLAVIFSLGAGVDYLVTHDERPEVPIVRMVNPDLTQRMTEWVVLQVLIQHRRQRAYDRQQAEQLWRPIPQPAAADVRVGIMGLGVLGSDAADVLKRLGFAVAGWSRTAKMLPGIETFHGAAGLSAFLARTDIVVCLLPLTPATRGILDRNLFEKLPRDGPLGGPALINAGRGGLQNEADIVAALDGGVLIGASLDVFEVEPLPEMSPLWRHPNVIVTPHAAAHSDPKALSAAILRQIVAFEAGEKLANVVDRATSY